VPRAPRHECRIHRCGLGLSLALGWIHFNKLISEPESSLAGWSGKPRCESLRASGADSPGADRLRCLTLMDASQHHATTASGCCQIRLRIFVRSECYKVYNTRA